MKDARNIVTVQVDAVQVPQETCERGLVYLNARADSPMSFFQVHDGVRAALTERLMGEGVAEGGLPEQVETVFGSYTGDDQQRFKLTIDEGGLELPNMTQVRTAHVQPMFDKEPQAELNRWFQAMERKGCRVFEMVGSSANVMRHPRLKALQSIVSGNEKLVLAPGKAERKRRVDSGKPAVPRQLREISIRAIPRSIPMDGKHVEHRLWSTFLVDGSEVTPVHAMALVYGERGQKRILAGKGAKRHRHVANLLGDKYTMDRTTIEPNSEVVGVMTSDVERAVRELLNRS